jgi:hypothetical protein
VQHELASLATDRLHGGPALLLPPRETAKLVLHTDTRRATAGTFEASAATEPGSGSSSWSVSPEATLRPLRRLLLTAKASYQEDVIGWQWASTQPAAGGDVWWVARVRQRTASFSLQADLAFTPRLVLQVHAQPFATAGRYDRWGRVAEPRAGRASDRVARLAPDQVITTADTVTLAGPAGAWTLPRPDGAQRSFATSAVVRWEYAAGSFLTAVWTHRSEDVTSEARLDGDVLQPGSDRVMVKVSWRWVP